MKASRQDVKQTLNSDVSRRLPTACDDRICFRLDRDGETGVKGTFSRKGNKTVMNQVYRDFRL